MHWLPVLTRLPAMVMSAEQTDHWPSSGFADCVYCLMISDARQLFTAVCKALKCMLNDLRFKKKHPSSHQGTSIVCYSCSLLPSQVNLLAYAYPILHVALQSKYLFWCKSGHIVASAPLPGTTASAFTTVMHVHSFSKQHQAQIHAGDVTHYT